jgi:hypothetical protein
VQEKTIAKLKSTIAQQQEIQSTIAQQQREIASLTASLKEQALQIQKVNERLALQKSATNFVASTQ